MCWAILHGGPGLICNDVMMHELMCNDIWINVNYAGLVNYCVLMYEKMWLPYTVYALLIFCVCIKCLLLQHKTLLSLYRIFMSTVQKVEEEIYGSIFLFMPFIHLKYINNYLIVLLDQASAFLFIRKYLNNYTILNSCGNYSH